MDLAVKLAESAEASRQVDVHRYRHLVFGEHIIIRPDRSPERLELRGTPLAVAEIAIGFERRPAGKTQFKELLVIDHEGRIHQFGPIPREARDTFGASLDRWFAQRVKATQAARQRAEARAREKE